MAAGGEVIHQQHATALPLENHLQETVLHWHQKLSEGTLEGGGARRERKCVCVYVWGRQCGMIDMNHYGEHGRVWQKASRHFIFCTFVRIGVWPDHTERALNMWNKCDASPREANPRLRHRWGQTFAGDALTQTHWRAHLYSLKPLICIQGPLIN